MKSSSKGSLRPLLITIPSKRRNQSIFNNILLQFSRPRRPMHFFLRLSSKPYFIFFFLCLFIFVNTIALFEELTARVAEIASTATSRTKSSAFHQDLYSRPRLTKYDRTPPLSQPTFHNPGKLSTLPPSPIP